jgi:hypothetical protein
MGWVYLSNRSSPAAPFFEAYGSFGPTIANCSGTMSGNCCYGATGSSDGGAPVAVSAGNLTLLDGATSIGQLIAPGYSALTWSAVTWQTGDSLSVNAQGDPSGVAFFSGSVTAPGVLTNVSPVFTSTQINLSSANDYTVSWMPGSGGSKVHIEANTLTKYVYCESPTSAGTITIPHALLAPLSGGGNAIVEVYTYNESVVTAANATVAIYATNGEMNQYALFQ